MKLVLKVYRGVQEPILPAEKEAMEKGREGRARKGDTRRSVELMRLMDEWLRKKVVCTAFLC